MQTSCVDDRGRPERLVRNTLTSCGQGIGSRYGREQRLRRKRDFDTVFRQAGVRLRRGPLRLMAHPNESGTARLGVVVAKRLIKRAVARNRAKRVLRESFRLTTGLPTMDIVVRVAQKDAQVTARDADWLFAALTRRVRVQDECVGEDR